MAQASPPERGPAWTELSLVLTDDRGSAEVNRLYLRHEGPTDVISFVYPPAAPGGGHGGEIVINVERALAEGRRRGSAPRELALYLAHGCDHLTGGRDRTTAGRARMRAREACWLKEAARLGLLRDLIVSGEPGPPRIVHG